MYEACRVELCYALRDVIYDLHSNAVLLKNPFHGIGEAHGSVSNLQAPVLTSNTC